MWKLYIEKKKKTSVEQIKRLTYVFEYTEKCKLMAVTSMNIPVIETRHSNSSNYFLIFLLCYMSVNLLSSIS